MAAPPSKQLAALIFTDLVGSVALQQRLGTEAYMRYVARHDEVFQECLSQVPNAEILNETGDGFLLRFDDPSDAVNTALRIQHRLHGEMAQGERIRVRIGVHVGVVTEMEERIRGEKRAVGMPINLTARIMDLADGGQILITRAVYDDARNYVREHPLMVGGQALPLQWISHGLYEFKGNPDPMEIFEVGVVGIAPLTAPESSGKAQRLSDRNGEQPVASAAAETKLEVLPPEDLERSDVFIAYAPVDDTPLLPGKPGWITQFHDHLQVRLEQLSGERVRVWRDVAPVQEMADERLLEYLPSVKTMVSVVSPPFMKAPVCLKEVDTFWRSAERNGTFQVSNKTRMMKVVKTPVQPGIASPEVESLMAQLAGFDFFETDQETGRVLAYDETFGDKAVQRYFERVYDIAYELRDVLQAMGSPRANDLPAVAASSNGGNGTGKTVYLAECTSDLQMERDKLKRELLEHGHRVVPELPLPFSGAEFEREVRLLLEESDLAIHLVGSRYGMVLEDTEGSVVELQNQLAAERADAGNFKRFIWMPRDVEPRSDRQAAFVRLLVEDPAAHRGGEVIQDSMANFKQLLLKALTPPPEEPAAPQTESGTLGVPKIYLIYDQRDEAAVEPLEDLLFELGFEVTGPSFEGDETEANRIHQHNLLHCDGALVYYGAVTKPWIDMQLMDIAQAPGYGRTKELLASAVCVAPSDDRRKTRFRTHLADVIRYAAAAVTAAELEPFTARLRKEEPAQ